MKWRMKEEHGFNDRIGTEASTPPHGVRQRVANRGGHSVLWVVKRA